jgi:hypothetical protein
MSNKIKLEFNPETMTVADMKKAVQTLRHLFECYEELSMAVNINETLSHEDACDELMYMVDHLYENYEV